MKAQILEFLTDLPELPEAQFNKAFELYRKTTHKNLSSERFYNAAGYTKINLENLLYDLKQLHGIADTEVVAHHAIKAEKNNVPELLFENIDKTDVLEIKNYLISKDVEVPQVPSFAKGSTGTKERKAFATANNIISKSNKKADFEKAFKAWHDDTIIAAAKAYLAPKKEEADAPEDPKDVIEMTATTKEEVFTTAPDEVKEAVKLRDVYPFLNDTNCPEELYILVGKKFAHYNAYVKAHNTLLVLKTEEGKAEAPMTPEEIFELAKTAVENFEANELITKEMNYYQENGKILGEHPVFTERQLKAKIDVMTNAQAVTRKSNLENYIRKAENKIKKAKTEADIDKLNAKISKWNIELNLVNAKLGFSDK